MEKLSSIKLVPGAKSVGDCLRRKEKCPEIQVSLACGGTRRGSKPASLILWGEGRPSWGFLFNNQTEAAQTKHKERISPLDLFLPRRLGEESDSYLLS